MGNYYESFDPPFFLWYKSSDRSIEKNRLAYDRPDKEIVTDIVRTFHSLHHIDTSKVGVACRHNVVTLYGHCADQRVGRYLWAIADNTLGVRYVINELQTDENKILH